MTLAILVKDSGPASTTGESGDLRLSVGEGTIHISDNKGYMWISLSEAQWQSLVTEVENLHAALKVLEKGGVVCD